MKRIVTGTFMLAAVAFAQSADPATIAQRKENQQDRIANGVQSGQLTAGETKTLESKEANLNRETRDDRQANGGKLTGQEKQQINTQQNHLSNQIYADKHNANTAHYGNNEVGQRRENQQDRIANGVQSGQLTAGETKNLESREANVNREIKDDRQADGGKLTTQERQQVNQQQNNMSKSIYADKHNANTAHYGNNEVGQRRENQQDRIAQGIKSGQMTAGEAAKTENREQGINQQVHADRQANGGKLTGREKSQINHEQNGASRQIYRQKHNNKVAPK